MKLRGEKERSRLATAEQALEDRLKDAERRHEECIRVIRDRAGNENTKVDLHHHEVMFINIILIPTHYLSLLFLIYY